MPVITATNKRIKKNCNRHGYINHLLRRRLLVSYSIISVQFMKHEGSLPSSWQPVTATYISESESIPHSVICFATNFKNYLPNRILPPHSCIFSSEFQTKKISQPLLCSHKFFNNLKKKNLHVCTVHQWRLEHFIIQQMHKYIIRRYN